MFFGLFVSKPKTAYGMRISDWSSDVFSSDLRARRARCGQETPALFGEILQDRARLEHGDRIAALRRIPIDDRGELVVRVDAPELGGQLIAVEDVIGNDAIGRTDFLQHDRDLLPIWSRRIMKVDYHSTSWSQ